MARQINHFVPLNVVKNLMFGRRLQLNKLVTGGHYNIHVDIRARVAARRPELATLFDAQLLMLDDPLLGVDSHFDPNAMAWIGSANKETNVCVVWHTSPIQTIEDVKHREMVVGTSGRPTVTTDGLVYIK